MIKDILLYIWQLPQHLLALILLKVWKVVGCTRGDFSSVYWIKKPYVGVSLGRYIFLDGDCGVVDIKHECGHSAQSRRFGWFYLLIVGLPSALGNLWDRIFHRSWAPARREKWYYSRWPENQADRLGGVDNIRSVK